MYDTLTGIQEQYLNNEFATEEEYHAAMEEAKAHYYQKLQDYSSLYQVALTTDSKVVADAWSTDFADMTYNTDDWMTAVNKYVEEVSLAFSEWSLEMDQIALETGTDLDNLESNIKDITTESERLKKTLTDKDGVIDAINTEANAVAGVTSNYALLRTSMQETISKYEELGRAADESIRKQQKAIIEGNNNTTLFNPSTTGGSEDENGDGEGNNFSNYSGVPVPPIKPIPPAKVNVPEIRVEPSLYDTGRGGTTVKVSEITVIGNHPEIGSYNKSLWKVGFSGGRTGYISQDIYNNVYLKYLKDTEEYNKKKAQYDKDLIKYNQDKAAYDKAIASMDTGGYTGSWGSEGKLAMLHEKELILNADDTTNFLASLEVLREIINTINLHSMNAQLGGLLNTPYQVNTDQSQMLEQQVHIEASFPNVQNRSEIEEAFNNLINRASQFVNRK